MKIRDRFLKKTVLAFDPHAFDPGTLLAQLEENKDRLANDPVVQRRLAESNAAVNREILPYLVGGIVLNALGSTALTLFFPTTVSPVYAVTMFCISSIGIWHVLRKQ